jgi:uncharacterized protein YciI
MTASPFFIYSRAAGSAASVEHDPALDEQHWSYMDRFADAMIARGPTLAADRETWTGSVHIVDLPSADAARAFVEREPYNVAGLYEHHSIRRFVNLLGRTMWEFPGEAADPRFFVIAHLVRGGGEPAARRPPPDFTDLPRELLIVHGEPLTPDGARPAGVALALQAPTREAVGILLRRGRPRLDDDFELQIHDWEFGGRR